MDALQNCARKQQQFATRAAALAAIRAWRGSGKKIVGRPEPYKCMVGGVTHWHIGRRSNHRGGR